MILLSGADLVLPDRVVSSGTLVLDGDRIVDVGGGAVAGGARDLQFDFPQHYIVRPALSADKIFMLRLVNTCILGVTCLRYSTKISK